MDCAFDGCGRPAAKGGYCWGHCKQRQEGKPLTPLRDSLSPSERLTPRDLLRKSAVDYVEAGDLDHKAAEADENLRKAAMAYAKVDESERRREHAERVRTGMARAARAGKHIGRPPSRDDREVAEVVRELGSIRRTAKLLKCSRDLVRGAVRRVKAAEKEAAQVDREG